MDLIGIVAVFVVSVALGLAGTRAIFEAMFFAMTRARPLHNSPLTEGPLHEAPPAWMSLATPAGGHVFTGARERSLPRQPHNVGGQSASASTLHG